MRPVHVINQYVIVWSNIKSRDDKVIIDGLFTVCSVNRLEYFASRLFVSFLTNDKIFGYDVLCFLFKVTEVLPLEDCTACCAWSLLIQGIEYI